MALPFWPTTLSELPNFAELVYLTILEEASLSNLPRTPLPPRWVNEAAMPAR
jgi:hypothetical protein